MVSTEGLDGSPRRTCIDMMNENKELILLPFRFNKVYKFKNLIYFTKIRFTIHIKAFYERRRQSLNSITKFRYGENMDERILKD